MASTTEEVLQRHVKCFFEGDLEGIVSDYSADAVLFTPNGPLKGHDPIREFFRALIKEFGQPGTTFSMQLQSIDGDFAYALWSAETADNVYEMATDTQSCETARSSRNRLPARSSRNDNVGRPNLRPVDSTVAPAPATDVVI